MRSLFSAVNDECVRTADSSARLLHTVDSEVTECCTGCPLDFGIMAAEEK